MKSRNVFITSLLVVILAIAVILFSTDKPTAALTALTLFLAALTLVITVDKNEETSKQTERSLQLTEITLKNTEINQQIRDIENRLEKFYLPAKDAINMAERYMKDPNNPSLLRIVTENYDFANDDPHIEIAIRYVIGETKPIRKYRFKAKENTYKAFEKLINEENNEAYNRFLKNINKEIEDFQQELKDLKNSN